MTSLMSDQYALVRATRETLFGFLEEMPHEQLHADVPHFGFRTIARTHLHVAGCYMHWLGHFANVRNAPLYPSEAELNSATVSDIRHWFAESDTLVADFLAMYEGRFETMIHHPSEPELRLTGLWLMTHTITHEFHHKGQIVTMARILGYVPPDTDLVVPLTW